MNSDIPLRPEEDLVLDENPQVLFEDDALIVVSKGAPLPAHAVSRFLERNLLTILEKRYSQKLYLAHRLDSETSGLMLVARNEEIAGTLGSALQDRKVQKEYLAVLRGAPPERQGRVQLPIKGRRDQLCHIYEPHPEGKEAETEYEVLKTNATHSLVKLIPHTGRTHQLRVHMKALGCPIAGDKIYIDLKVYDHYVHHGWQEWMAGIVGIKRLALHASKLTFVHPVSKKEMTVESPLPAELKEFFAKG